MKIQSIKTVYFSATGNTKNGTIMRSKKILLVVSGEEKAQALKDSIYGPVTPEVPGSILRFHPDVTIIADEAAMSLIK